MKFWRRSAVHKNFEHNLNEELRFHIERQTAANIAAGMRSDEAKRQAVLQLGAAEGVKEDCREQSSGYWLETLVSDLRYGLRMLRKNHGFTPVAVLTLALGIGATTAVFSVVNTILLKPLPYSNPEKIVMLWWKSPISSTQSAFDQFPWAPHDFVHFSSETKTFQSLGAFKSDFFNLAGHGDPARLDGLRASAG